MKKPEKFYNLICRILEEQGFKYEGIILVKWMNHGKKRQVQTIRLTPQAYKDLGLNPHEWHQIIRNIKQPDFEQAQRIADALGITVGELSNNYKSVAA